MGARESYGVALEVISPRPARPHPLRSVCGATQAWAVYPICGVHVRMFASELDD